MKHLVPYIFLIFIFIAILFISGFESFVKFILGINSLLLVMLVYSSGEDK